MLLNIKTGHGGLRQTPVQHIIFLVSSLPKVVEQGVPFVFTDRHAYLKTAVFSSELTDLSRIDWTILRTRDFKRNPDDPGKFERYQAEALIYRHLPVTALTGIACQGAAQQTLLRRRLDEAGVSLSVLPIPNWYF